MRKYLVVTRIHMINAFVYRAQFVTRLAFNVLFIFIFFSLWGAIYRNGTVQGYSHTQVVWYLIVTEFIVLGCSSPIFGQMNEDVKNGAISYLLLRPMNYIAYQFAAAAGENIVKAAFFGALGIVLGLVFVGPIPGFVWQAVPLMALSIALGITLQFFMQMALGLTAFRLEDNTALYFIFQKLVFMLGVFLPVEFLPGWLQPIAKALPFSYVGWAPARLAVDFRWEFFCQVLPLQLVWTLFAVGLAILVYRTGVRGLRANGG